MISLVMRRPLFYGAVVFAAFIGFQQLIHPVSKLPPNDISLEIEKGGQALVQGIIRSDVQEQTSFYGQRQASFILDARSISRMQEKHPKTVVGSVKVYLDFGKNRDGSIPIFSFGDELILRGELKRPKGLRNPGGFDARAYWERRGVRTLFFAAKKFPVKVIARHRGNPVQEAAIRFKRFLSRQVASEFNFRDAAFLKALFLGERSDLDGDFRDLFVKTGTMHLLAVSGFNVAFLAASALFLLGLLRIGPRPGLGITLGIVWFYCLLVGWEASVVRATWMASLFILGKILGRKTDALNTLGFAALLILIVSPKQLFDMGFQLSFMAVMGLVILMPIFYKKPLVLPNEKQTAAEKALEYLKELFWGSFVCLAVTLPVTVQSFYIVTPLSLLANVVVVPLVMALFFLGFVYFLSFGWFPKFLMFLPWVMTALMKITVSCLYFIESLPGAYFIVGRLHPVLWGILVLGIVCLIGNKKFKNRWAKAAAILLFCAGLFVVQEIVRAAARHGVWPSERKLTLTVLDVGQGDALYVEFPEGENMLIDAGPGGDRDSGRRVIAPFLKFKGVRAIDTFVISHPQADHLGGAPVVFDEFQVRNVVRTDWAYHTRLFDLVKSKIKREGAREWTARRGMRLKGVRNVAVEVLNPFPDQAPDKNVNNDSIVLKITYGNTRFLLAGDIEDKAMRRLLDEEGKGGGLRCAALKVPHHGAKLREAGQNFVREVHPEISVISVGENNPFHHPSPEALAVLASIEGNRVLRTDKGGAVRLASNGSAVTILDGLS